MRCWPIILSPLLCLSACASEIVLRPPPPPVNWHSLDMRPSTSAGDVLTATRREHTVAAAYTQALASQDFAALGTLLDEHAHFTLAGYHDVHGRGSVVRAHEGALGAYEQRNVVPRRVLLTDSAQAIEWTMTAVHRATQRPVAIDGLVLLWTRDSGAIWDVHLYYDQGELDAQVNVGVEAATSAALAAPATANVQELERTGEAVEDANTAAVRAALDALESGAEERYLATMTDELEVRTAEATNVVRGRAAARAYFHSMRKSISGLDVQLDNNFGVGPFVVAEYHLVGEQQGPIGRIPAQKDTLIKMYVVDVAELRGGRIARIWRYDDPLQILASSTGGSP